jgi:type II secretory ATPase GspE/PulE/Tfp pilus assembly ATPase PilB-like protein
VKNPILGRQELLKALKAIYPDYPNTNGNKDIDTQLVNNGIISEQKLIELYSQIFDIPLFDEESSIDFSIPVDIPQEYLNANLCLVLEKNEDSLLFLVSDPYNLENISREINRSLKLKCQFTLGRRTFVERLLSRKQSVNNEEEEVISDDENTLRSMAGEAKIVRLVNDIFTQAIESGSSDIHIEPGFDSVSVRCRIDGVLTEIMNCPLNQFPAIASRIKLLGNLNIAESRLPQDGRTNLKLGARELDMRISTIPILTGESIVLRLLNQDTLAFDLRTLGMNDKHLEQFNKIINVPHGIILVVGPTGSGKTTTLYSVISKLNDNKKKIITVEDPVEYQMPGLCQMQVNHKIGVTFASGLRHIVRQDPDVILVGEIRDKETADIAINAALTGHLVLSTLHTNDAVGAVTRLLDMGVENFLVSSALTGVLSQRLVRKICTSCNGSGSIDGARCKRCNGSGFKGRSGIFELLKVDDEIRVAVNRNASSSELEKIAIKNGMTTLREDGLAKVAQGITTLDELDRSAAEM